MAEFIQRLQQPLKHVTIRYRAQDGDVVVRARLVHLVNGGTEIRAKGVSVDEPMGSTVAAAEQVTLRPPLPWATDRLEARVSGLRLSVERDETGRLSIDRLIPKKAKEKPTEFPYQVHVERSSVSYTDLPAKEAGRWKVDFSVLSVNGFGETVLTKFDAYVEGAGRVSGYFTIRGGTPVDVHVETPSLRVDKVRRYIDNISEIKRALAADQWDFAIGGFSGTATWQRFGDSQKIFVKGKGNAENLGIAGRRFTRLAFEGVASESHASGTIVAEAPGFRASGRGGMTYGTEFALRFDGTVRASSSDAFERIVGDVLPTDLAFREGFFEGSVEVGKTFALAGTITGAKGSFREYEATRIRARMHGNNDTIRFSEAVASLYDANVKGDVLIKLSQEPSIKAFVFAPGVSLELIPNLPENYVRGGRVDLYAAIDGSLANPKVTAEVKGVADLLVQSEQESVVETVDVQARGIYDDGKLTIVDAEFQGPLGFASLTGVLDLERKVMDVDALIDSLNIGALPESPALGTLFAKLDVTGWFDDAVLTGPLEVYGIQVDEWSVPFASAISRWEGNRLRLSGIDARSGVSLATGDLSVEFGDSRSISGSGKVVDLGLAQLTEGVVTGLGSGAWEASGTIDEPIFSANIESNLLFVDKVSIDKARVALRWLDGVFSIHDFEASLGAGRLLAVGTYTLSGESQLRVEAIDIPIESLQPFVGAGVTLGGTLYGAGTIGFIDGRPRSGSASVGINSLAMDDVILGSGEFQGTLQDQQVVASGGIGSLDGFVTVEDASYNLESRALGGSMGILDVNSEPIWRIASKHLGESFSYNLRNALDSSRAKVSATAEFSGVLDDPRVDGSLIVDDIVFDGRNIGKFSASAVRDARVWTIEAAELTEGPVRMSLTPGKQNYIVEGGDLELDGEVSNADLGWLRNIWPELQGLSGSLYLPFTVTGAVASPVIRASVGARDLRFNDYAADGLNVDQLMIQEGSVSADSGALQVRGMEIKLLNAHVPFHYPFEFPGDEPVAASFEVPPRDINALSRFFGGLDAAETRGEFLGGAFLLSGTINNLEATGSVAATAERLKFEDIETVFAVRRAEVSLRPGNVLSLSLEATGANAGTINASLFADLKSQSYQEGSFIEVDGLPVRESLGRGDSVSGVLSVRNVKVQGSLAEPVVGGGDAEILVQKGRLRLTGEIEVGEPLGLLPINPYFEIPNLVFESAEYISGSMSAEIVGRGFVKGTIAQPTAEADFVVQKGSISLPSGRIQLERGGHADFKYARSYAGEQQASLNIALPAVTRAIAFDGISVQTYRINLFVTGDLLSGDELTIDANSDPPGLSRDQIFAILGQQRLFETVGGAITGNFQRQLSDILSLAAPSLLDPFTRGLEESLGLDYIYVDFSQGAGIVVLGKELGLGFTLEYSQPITGTREGPFAVDQLRLIYRPRTRNPLLNRLSLALGLDDTGLWKLSLAYSGRF